MRDRTRNHESLTVPFPPSELLERMRALAAQHDRSFNGELVRAIPECVQRHEDEAPA